MGHSSHLLRRPSRHHQELMTLQRRVQWRPNPMTVSVPLQKQRHRQPWGRDRLSPGSGAALVRTIVSAGWPRGQGAAPVALHLACTAATRNKR